MKTTNRIEITPGIASRRGLTARNSCSIARHHRRGWHPVRCNRLRPEHERNPRRHTVCCNRERARTQTDRGPPASRSTSPGRRLDPVAGGERAHRAGVREGALNVSPRVGHLHINVDDLPWLWADASNINTIDMAGMPPGPHKVRIDLFDANHQVFPGQSKTVEFTVTGTGSHAH
jgi:hypothetical protein